MQPPARGPQPQPSSLGNIIQGTSEGIAVPTNLLRSNPARTLALCFSYMQLKISTGNLLPLHIPLGVEAPEALASIAGCLDGLEHPAICVMAMLDAMMAVMAMVAVLCSDGNDGCAIRCSDGNDGCAIRCGDGSDDNAVDAVMTIALAGRHGPSKCSAAGRQCTCLFGLVCKQPSLQWPGEFALSLWEMPSISDQINHAAWA
eukprot:1159858-Pelagomonas_calceolata.AAC.6